MYSGYLAGCTVFLDSNKNGVLDADEAEATTTPYGRFELAVMEDLDLADKNVVVKTGGDCKDTSTDLNLAVEMTVKATCATGGMDSGGMVNLITAIQGLLAVGNISAAVDAAADDAAKRRVIIGSGLALPADFDACKYDPLSAAWSASATEQAAFANFVRTNVELTTLVKTLSDVTGYADEATYNQASKAILRGIATLFEDFSRIAGQTGVEACENKGFDASECGAVGCCNYDDGSCMSGVGDDLCSGDMPCAAECSTGTCDSFADASKPECAACMVCQRSTNPCAASCPIGTCDSPADMSKSECAACVACQMQQDEGSGEVEGGTPPASGRRLQLLSFLETIDTIDTPTWGRRLAAAGGLSVGSVDNIKALIQTASDATSGDITDSAGLVAQIASSTAALVVVLAEQVDSIVAEVIAGQSANASGVDISTIALAMQDLAKCSVVAQDANTATKAMLQNATSESIATGAITAQVKAQLDARAGKAAFQLEMDAAVVPLPVQIPSPAPPPPPPSPSLPPPTLPPPAPPPSTESVVLKFTASGSVSEWTTQDESSVQRKIAAIAGTTASAVIITVAAGSVLVTATIAVPAATTAAAMMVSLSARLGSAADASAALGITVESVPTIREKSNGVEVKDTKTMPMDLLALILALVFLLPPMLGMAYALIMYRGQECKYLSYRFSHGNPNVNVGYMPKERREALWAEISAGKIKTGKKEYVTKQRMLAVSSKSVCSIVVCKCVACSPCSAGSPFTYVLPTQDREGGSFRLGLRRGPSRDLSSSTVQQQHV